MIKVAEVLIALGVKDFVLRGNPTNETEYFSMFRKIIGETSDGTGVEEDDPTKFGATWAEITAKMDELKEAEPMRVLREERNKKLAETDWWAGSDVTMTSAQKKYRQDLRDFPASGVKPKVINGPNNLLDMSSVTWPTKP